jgi:hypothetical protein
MREATKPGWDALLAVFLTVVLVSCGGGSGSTGLITSEGNVVDDVQQTGTCEEFAGTPYCGTDSTDAIAPGGQRVSVVTAVPTAVPTPSPATSASTTPGPGATATPDGPTAGVPTATSPISEPTASPGDQGTVTAVVDGFEEGAACAAATRPAGSNESWRTAPLVPLGAAGEPVTFPLPSGTADPFDAALVCFADPPGALPAELVTLADADPTVIFVLPAS